MKAALAELAAGRTVLIFPEGTRTPDGALGEFQRGVMLLIKRSRAQVVPVALEGASDIWPIGTALPRLRGRLGVMAAQPGLEEILERYGVGSAVLLSFQRDAPLIRKLLEAGWVCVHRSTSRNPIVLLVENSEANRALIALFGIPLALT